MAVAAEGEKHEATTPLQQSHTHDPVISRISINRLSVECFAIKVYSLSYLVCKRKKKKNEKYIL